ncbi:hypothetical protein OESDEN_17287, partial [Oesophagostomum dentatum]
LCFLILTFRSLLNPKLAFLATVLHPPTVKTKKIPTFLFYKQRVRRRKALATSHQAMNERLKRMFFFFRFRVVVMRSWRLCMIENIRRLRI